MSTDAAVPVASTHRGLFRSFCRNPLSVIGLVVLVVMIAGGILAPWIEPHNPNAIILSLSNSPPFHSHYLLGGDADGRDIFSRLIAGTRGAIEAAGILTGIAAALGIAGGLVAGYFGRLVDNLSSWAFAVLMACPWIVILIGLYTIGGTSPNFSMAILGVLMAPTFFWPVRTLSKGVTQEPYVDAARVSGLPRRRIVGRHVLFAVRGPIIIIAAFVAGFAVSAQATLQFLGLGDPTIPSWGGMLSDALNNIYISPIQIVWPGLFLALFFAACMLVANGLRDALSGTGGGQGLRARHREIARLRAAECAREAQIAEPPALDTESAGTPTQSGVDDTLLRIENLEINYLQGRTLTRAVDGVSLSVRSGEIMGLIGESGSGKSQTIFATLGLLPQEAVLAGGSIRFDGVELLGRSQKEMGLIRGSKIGYVPQDAVANLDPSFRVGTQLVYGIRASRDMSKQAARDLALSMLERVHIADPERTFRSYPHEISGGMAQRVLIAGAVANSPRLLLADEPTSALDVTVQAEVLDLLRELQKETGMSVLIVTHNFGVVADLCQRVSVMRNGRLVEQGPVERVFSEPHHEYTRMLLDSIVDDSSSLRAELPQLGVTGV